LARIEGEGNGNSKTADCFRQTQRFLLSANKGCCF